MAINHTGHDEGIGEIDDLHSLRRRGRDAVDSMILDRDVNVVSNLSRFDVQEATGLNRDGRSGRCGSGGRW